MTEGWRERDAVGVPRERARGFARERGRITTACMRAGSIRGPWSTSSSRCQVITVEAERGTRYGPDRLRPVGVQIKAPRVLLRTNTYTDYANFQRDFAALEPALVDWFKERGVTTVGVDTASVDLFDSKKLEAHDAFLRNDITIIEGLILKDVPDGMYNLIALPLKLVGYDGSPVRAVLRSLSAGKRKAYHGDAEARREQELYAHNSNGAGLEDKSLARR